MAVGICQVCRLAFNGSICPRCASARISFDERFQPLEPTDSERYYERRQTLLASREKSRKQYGPLSHEAVRFIAGNIQNSIEWCGESREGAELRKTLEHAQLLIGTIIRSRAV